ncbi:MAG: phage tail family protein [Erysipelotrichaceae bacterium]
MKTITYKNSKNQSLVLGEDPRFQLIDLQGLNPPKATFSTSTLAGFDGSRVNGSMVNARNILMTLQLSGDIEENRLKLYDIFKVKRSGTLIYNSEVLSIQIEAYVESVEIPPMVWPIKALISLICPQPYFEDLQDILVDVTSIESAFSFPLELISSGEVLGIIHPSEATNILNPGDIQIGMIIRFQAIGQVVNPKILNTITLEYIQLQLTLQAGDVVVINTEVGQKRIELTRAGETTNQFNTLVLGSTFLQLDEGDNVLYVTCTSGSTFLLTQLTIRPKYYGA